MYRYMILTAGKASCFPVQAKLNKVFESPSSISCLQIIYHSSCGSIESILSVDTILCHDEETHQVKKIIFLYLGTC